jgi:transcriptional regulator with XRE-family HTH domain
MNKDFPRIITLLRKEKKLSQKQAAQDLGVSQALLSHYEKGIRECGLDFVVQAADYYNVSCDYLLGKTAERSFDVSELDNSAAVTNTANSISRRLISASMNIIYDLLTKLRSRKLTRVVTVYLLISIYKVFRLIYSANPGNAPEMFTIPQNVYRGYATAAQEKLFTDIENLCSSDTDQPITKLSNLSPEILAEQYHEEAAALFNVIQQSENVLSKIKRSS